MMTEAPSAEAIPGADQIFGALSEATSWSEIVAAGTTDAQVERSDGRTVRRDRNRHAVIVALLDTMREGNFFPSVGDIADRAQVSHRSVFRYFDDIEDLVQTAIDYEFRRVVPLTVIHGVGVGSLERRVDALVESRMRVFEALGAVARAARVRAPEVSVIDNALIEISALHRGVLIEHFAPELADRDPTNARNVIDAVMTMTSFESYDIHLRIYGRVASEIRASWMHALLALLRS